jgi:hypothetical protein
VIIPSNKSGLGSGTSGKIVAQSPQRREETVKNESAAHEKSEGSAEQIREYGYVKRP